MAIARLRVRDVAVVVLDEATARMDPQTERLVSGAVDQLLAGRTGVIVAHRLSTVRHCDTVAVLDRGEIVQQGERARLAVRPGPFRDLLRAAGSPPAAGSPTAGEPAVPRRGWRWPGRCCGPRWSCRGGVWSAGSRSSPRA